MKTGADHLFAALDDAGFSYRVDHSNAGTPYANFRWVLPRAHRDSVQRAYTALAEADALRLSLYDPLPGTIPDAVECERMMRPFPITRLYHGTDSGQLELCLAVPIAGVVLDPDTLKVLLSYLGQCGEQLLNPGGRVRQPPPLRPGASHEELVAALRRYGLTPQRDKGSLMVDLSLPGLGSSGRFSIDQLGVGWLRFSAWLIDSDALMADRISPAFLNQLQVWAPVGRFVLEPRPGVEPRLAVEIATPCLGRDAGAVVGESMRQATRILGTAVHHARAPSS